MERKSGPAKRKEVRMTKYRNESGNSTAPAEISGIQVVRQQRTKKQRAALAAAIGRGETRLGQLTCTQIAHICGVSAQYVHRVQLTNSVTLAQAAE
jgi:hypothetical protein